MTVEAFQAAVDVVVVGSGVAGLTTAHDAAAAGLTVLIVTKDAAEAGSTRWAQGGIAVVDAAGGDSIEAHLHDTVVAGAGLTDPVVAAAVVTEGIAAVARLRARGAVFDSLTPGAGGVPGTLLRTREGGHHADRIIHAGGDATGAEVERALLSASGLPAVLTGHLALDVVTDRTGRACGVTVLTPDGRIAPIGAGAVVLATGGCGQLFAATSNPPVATADGVAMALRAGAAVADLEFVQFHPTVLFVGGGRPGQRPLVSEAVRGAGAVLLDGAGARVMTGVHPLADLAPRDVVSLAITRRLATAPGGIDDHVFLDARGIDEFARRFPTITASCAAVGLDPQRELIPVAPAEHFQCGGVVTDLQGRTTIDRLYAVGEVARTGLHGANRLASNSLLEGLVMGERTALDIIENPVERPARTAGTSAPLPPSLRSPDVVPQIQRAMSRHVGIGRQAEGLALVGAALGGAGSAGEAAPTLDRESVEAANISLAARAVVTAATARTESRGAHVRLDFPGRRLDWAQPISWTLERSDSSDRGDGELRMAPLRTAVPA